MYGWRCRRWSAVVVQHTMQQMRTARAFTLAMSTINSQLDKTFFTMYDDFSILFWM